MHARRDLRPLYRFALLAALVCAGGCAPRMQRAAAPAIAPAPAPHRFTVAGGGGVAPLAAHGARTADIRDFGASTSATDNTLAIERAYDSLSGGAQNGPFNLTPGTLYIPSGTWALKSPLMFDGRLVSIYCEPGAVLAMATQTSGPAILAGTKRATPFGGAWTGWSPTGFSTDHRIDMFGKLDTFAVPSAGQRYALCSRGTSSPSALADHSLWFYAVPPMTGAHDGYDSLQKFTLQIAFENLAGAVGSMPICGHGTPDSEIGFGPWSLYADGTKFWFKFLTKEGIGNPPGYRAFSFGDATQTGVQKLWVQIDLTTNDGSGKCAIMAGQNGQQAVVTPGIGTRNALGSYNFSSNATGGSFVFTGVRPDTNTATSVTVAFSDVGVQATMQGYMNTIYGAGNSLVTDPDPVLGGVTVQLQGALANLSALPPLVDQTNLIGGTVSVFGGDSGFQASQNLHFNAPGWIPFQVFSDGSGVSGPTTGHDSYSTVPVARLYGLQFRSDLVYLDQSGQPGGLPHAEALVAGGSNNDQKRYFPTFSPADPNSLFSLPLTDAPGDATKVSDKLIRCTVGDPSGGSPFGAWGWFECQVPDPQTNIDGQNYYNLTITTPEATAAGPHAGACMLCRYLVFAPQFKDCSFNGIGSGAAWWGLGIINGWDYRVNAGAFVGAGAGIFARDCSLAMRGDFLRAPVGRYYLHLKDTGLIAAASRLRFSGPYNFNQITDSCVRIQGQGGYSQIYDLPELSCDNEASTGTPVIRADYQSNVPQKITARGLNTSAQAGNPIVVLQGYNNPSGGVLPDPERYFNSVAISHITARDGELLWTDGPGWRVRLEDDMFPSDGETIRYTQAQPTAQGAVDYVHHVRALPVAGRFQAGSIRLKVWGPTAGNPEEYVCTTSGTSRWSSTYDYLGPVATSAMWAYVTDTSGNEYRQVAAAPVGTGPSLTPTGSIAITGVSNASPAVVTAPSHGLADATWVNITGVLGNTAVNGNWRIKVIDANTFKIEANQTEINGVFSYVAGNGAYTSGGSIGKWLYWMPTGRTSVAAPVWKALTTVAP